MIQEQYLLPQSLSNQILQLQIDIDSNNISEELLTQTVQAYVEAINHFSALAAQKSQEGELSSAPFIKRSKIYQQKMKRLLARRDVQNCLGGKENSFTKKNMQKQLKMIRQNTPEQAKTLANHYHSHMVQQQKLIENHLSKQKQLLSQRIARRSISRNKNPETLNKLDLILQPLKCKKLVNMAIF